MLEEVHAKEHVEPPRVLLMSTFIYAHYPYSAIVTTLGHQKAPAYVPVFFDYHLLVVHEVQVWFEST
ncbi:hypothetical protein GA0116948_10761 [Chitinophaga costaii]|uniref:Uncharacterized protein n=1 Tax=Chitinophaga costaii TaxID=1335309 RepID=A0A1C4E3F7_9BACT|nr:hypothetical protein GA0116948_10761 [Chitinophaga costaii]